MYNDELPDRLEEESELLGANDTCDWLAAETTVESTSSAGGA